MDLPRWQYHQYGWPWEIVGNMGNQKTFHRTYSVILWPMTVKQVSTCICEHKSSWVITLSLASFKFTRWQFNAGRSRCCWCHLDISTVQTWAGSLVGSWGFRYKYVSVGLSDKSNELGSQGAGLLAKTSGKVKTQQGGTERHGECQTPPSRIKDHKRHVQETKACWFHVPSNTKLHEMGSERIPFIKLTVILLRTMILPEILKY